MPLLQKELVVFQAPLPPAGLAGTPVGSQVRLPLERKRRVQAGRLPP